MSELRDRRQALGLTQAQVAVGARISVTYLHYIEEGLKPTRGTVLDRIEAVLSDPPPSKGPRLNEPSSMPTTRHRVQVSDEEIDLLMRGLYALPPERGSAKLLKKLRHHRS